MKLYHVIAALIVILLCSGCSPDEEIPRQGRLKLVSKEYVSYTYYDIIEDTLTGTQYLTNGRGIVRLDSPADFLFPLNKKEKTEE